MPISLKKGQKVSLTKENPGLKNVVVGIGWDINAFDTGGDFDLDAAAFCLTDSGKVSDQKDFVFYGNLTHPSGAIQHMGDNLTGAGDGDDEQIKIDLSKIPANITKIAFTVTIYEAEERRFFAMILARISLSKLQLYLANYIRMVMSGNSMPSEAVIRAA